jgi:hypothetical protein
LKDFGTSPSPQRNAGNAPRKPRRCAQYAVSGRKS